MIEIRVEQRTVGCWLMPSKFYAQLDMVKLSTSTEAVKKGDVCILTAEALQATAIGNLSSVAEFVHGCVVTVMKQGCDTPVVEVGSWSEFIWSCVFLFVLCAVRRADVVDT